MRVDIFDQKNKKVGTAEVSDKVFGAKWNPDLVHQVVQAQIANSRISIANTKGRGEVRGGGKKPWAQKGTGRARHGSSRSPIWIGGGVAHGPKKERNFTQKINKKMKRLALFSVLSKKFADGEVKFVEKLETDAPKTKSVAGMLKNLEPKKVSTLLLPGNGAKNIYRGAANLPKVKALDPASLNVYDLLIVKNVLIDQGAAEVISNHYRV